MILLIRRRSNLDALQILWFILICLLFCGFFFLDGFDLGTGMAIQTLAHNEDEKSQLIATIGPVWDGNEVWLITAGGAMFASFPYWYSTLFSGFYIILLLILAGLIIRGVSFEFRSKVPFKYKSIWDWTLTIGSAIVPFLFGMMFMSVVKGMPMTASGNIYAGFTNYVNAFSIVGGIALTLLCYIHGLNYIALKTTGDIRARARNYSELLYWILYIGLVVFVILLAFNTDFFKLHLIITSILLILIVALSVIGHVCTFKQHELGAFLSTGFTLITLVTMIFCGLFPRVMVATNPAHNLMIASSSSSPYTLKIMSITAISILPFILAYTIWAYYIFRKRISIKDVRKNGGY